MKKSMLVISTVTQSLVLQSPAAWDVAKRHGFEVTFAAARDAWVDSLNGNYIELPNARRLSPKALVRLACDLHGLLRRQDWDAVIVQTPIVGALVRLLAPRTLRSRTLYIVHGLHFYQESTPPALLFRVIEAALSPLTHVAVVNRWDFGWFENLPRPLRPRSLTRLPGAGVDTHVFATARPPRDAPTRYALFVGELNENKDPLFAIDVVNEARNNMPNLELVMIGSGPLNPSVTERCTRMDWVTQIARTTDVPSWIAGASALLAPSRREGLPRVHLEALAAGVPVLSRPNKGSLEVLRTTPHLLLGPEADAKMWAARLEEIICLKDDKQCAAIASEYDTTMFVKRLDEVFVSIWQG